MYAEKYLKEFNLTKKQCDELDQFYSEFKKTNKVVNLSSNITEEDFFIKNIRDSLGIINFINFKEGDNVIDVGTGGGFPGIILAMIYPNIKVTLLDSNRKKINWLNQISNKLALKNIEIIWGRIETQKQLTEKYDYVLFKAFAKTGIIIEIGSFLLKPTGLMILYKGNNYSKEIEKYDEKCILDKFDIKLDKVLNWDLIEGTTRYFIIFKKQGFKNAALPRRHNQMIAKPYF